MARRTGDRRRASGGRRHRPAAPGVPVGGPGGADPAAARRGPHRGRGHGPRAARPRPGRGRGRPGRRSGTHGRGRRR
ncbi:hypothetical protein [Ornithinimicrobium kibberense]|uniref:hypothetical protein n=1 Tax=Ornithinimicrobium kibberense TaxID=282060 RepID=UPI00360E8731